MSFFVFILLEILRFSIVERLSIEEKIIHKMIIDSKEIGDNFSIFFNKI